MSTTKTELEALRLARQAAREADEERLKIEAEKLAEVARKEAFRQRANKFTQKSGPTDEELMVQVKKEEGKRKVTRTLNRLMRDDPNENPLALEFSLRNRLAQPHHDEHQSGDQDWEIIEEEGTAPYYWNKRTNVSTYDNPFETNSASRPPPPPPPPRRLVGLKESKEVFWHKVIPPDGSHIYYWNKQTNESTFEQPEEYLEYDVAAAATASFPPHEDGDDNGNNDNSEDNDSSQIETGTASSAVDVLSDFVDVGEGSRAVGGDVATDDIQPCEMGKTWEEIIDPDSGELVYVYQSDEGEMFTRTDRPNGIVYVVSPPYVDDDGIEHVRESWEEMTSLETDENGDDLDLVYYKSLTTANIVNERPIGQVIIIEGIEGFE